MAEYVSLKEASRRFGYEASTIRRWLKEERVEGRQGPPEDSPREVSGVWRAQPQPIGRAHL